MKQKTEEKCCFQVLKALRVKKESLNEIKCNANQDCFRQYWKLEIRNLLPMAIGKKLKTPLVHWRFPVP